MVDEVGGTVGVLLGAFVVVGFLQCPMDKAVFGIHDGSLAVFLRFLKDAGGGLVTHAQYVFSYVKCLDVFLCLFVLLKEFDGKIACGIARTGLAVFLHFFLHHVDGRFNVFPMVDMDMSRHRLVGTWTMGIVVGMVAAMRVLVILVPFLDFRGYLGVDVAVFVDEVHPLIDVDDDMEQEVDTTPTLENRRYHRHTEKLTQFVEVDVVAPALGFIIHIECADHTHIHVYQLCGEIEVALQVARIDDIDHHVGGRFYELSAHVEFFRAIGRQRICSWQVDKAELIPLVLRATFLRVHSHARVVAHSLMSAGGEIEQGCLATIGISYQCHIDVPSSLSCSIMQLAFGDDDIFCLGLGEIDVLPVEFAAALQVFRLSFRDNLYHLGLVVPQ